jgi:ferredoxin
VVTRDLGTGVANLCPQAPGLVTTQDLAAPMEETTKQQSQSAIVVFKPSGQVVEVQIGTLLSDAAVEAGLSLNLPCGGQGRCGRCRVKSRARRRQPP